MAAPSSGGNLAMSFEALDALIRSAPYHRWLGIELKALAPIGIEILMPWREEFVAEPRIRYTHGGVLMALIDLAADFAIAAKLGRGVPTVDLRVDFHRAAMPGPLLAKASVIKLGGTLATAEARVLDENGALLASGRGVYLTQTR